MGQTPQDQIRWLDFNGISILLTVEANQPDPITAKSASEILVMRQAGEGWEEIARALGCKDVYAIIECQPPCRSENRRPGATAPAAQGARGLDTAGRAH